jgi:Flp pilus assembly protein TadG
VQTVLSIVRLLRQRSGQALRQRSGQATVEYVVIAGMLLATVAIMMVFLGTFREYGNRVLDLVGSEYP